MRLPPEQALRLTPEQVAAYVSSTELANRLRAEILTLDGDDNGLWERASRWQRGAPNADAVYQLGVQLGVDRLLVMSVEGRQEGGVQNAALACYFDTYILDIGSQTVQRYELHDNSGNLANIEVEMVRDAVRMTLEGEGAS